MKRDLVSGILLSNIQGSDLPRTEVEWEGLGGMLLPQTIIWMWGKERHQSDFLVEGIENCHSKRLPKRAAVEWLKAPRHM